MLKFGYELEGFFRNTEGQVTLPPREYTHDDFPGLVEVRNHGGGDIRDQLYMLKALADEYPRVDFGCHEHKFSPKERAEIRSRHYEKGGVAINNIYGKAPKDIGSKTLASFQINISDYQGEIFNKDGHGTKRYGVFDFVEIIRNLDTEFKDEITTSGRQPGFYSIKEGVRVEYRSLPNSVILIDSLTLINRIRKCL